MKRLNFTNLFLLAALIFGNHYSGVAHGNPPDQKVQAAAYTAANNGYCQAVKPFYWEVGTRDSVVASGSVGLFAPNANTSMKIASASKWFFGAYLVELRQGNLNSSDIQALTLNSGYTNLSYDSCEVRRLGTVADCFNAPNLNGHNSDFNPDQVGKFYYNGGHFQKYAAINLGLGPDRNAALLQVVTGQIGSGFTFSYDSPQLAAGVEITANDYAVFLRKLLKGELIIAGMLGSEAVCTNPSTCPSAIYTPIPENESWHYSLGHWVEDDPNVGDGSFSSPGAFGFYPWIDSTKTYYGILAREDHDVSDSVAFNSVECGRQIRKAFTDGQSIPPQPTSGATRTTVSW